jgi:hypothetical protein
VVEVVLRVYTGWEGLGGGAGGGRGCGKRVDQWVAVVAVGGVRAVVVAGDEDNVAVAVTGLVGGGCGCRVEIYAHETLVRRLQAAVAVLLEILALICQPLSVAVAKL